MDELFQPIKSVLPSGLTLITMRTGRKGLIGGEIRIGFGAAHAAKINPHWVGLPHFLEHVIVSGASRRFEAEEVTTIMRDYYGPDHNAWTGYFESRYLSSLNGGQALSARHFWDAFDAAADQVFFPKFDAPTIGHERKRIIEERARNLNHEKRNKLKFLQTMFHSDDYGLIVTGTEQQINSYTLNDLIAYHQYYSLPNASISIVGDVNHDEAIERISSVLAGASVIAHELPVIKKSQITTGELRLTQKGSSTLTIELYFDAPTIADEDHYAMRIGSLRLGGIVSDKIEKRFGLYSSGLAYQSWLPSHSRGHVILGIETSHDKEAANIVKYALEVMQSPDTRRAIWDAHERATDKVITSIELDQSSVQTWTKYLNSVQAMGVEPRSFEDEIKLLKRTTPEQVNETLSKLNSASMFMHLRGDAKALKKIPSIDVIDSWRSKPEYPAMREPKRSWFRLLRPFGR